MTINLGNDFKQIDQTLKAFDESNINYVLMDSYESLPHFYEGKDIDILISESSINKLSNILKKHGFVQTSPNSSVSWVAFFYSEEAKAWIIIDIFVAKRWHSYSAALDLLNNHEKSKKGYRIIPKYGLIAWKIYKDILSGRLTEKKRWGKIVELAGTCSVEEIINAKKTLLKFGLNLKDLPSLNDFLNDVKLETDPDKIINEARSANIKKKRKKISVNGKPNIKAFIDKPSDILNLVGGMIKKSSYALPAVAVVGIDGSGKTTLCNRLLESEFRKTNTLHIIMRRVDPVLPIYRSIRDSLSKMSKSVQPVFFIGSFISFVLKWIVDFGDYIDRFYRYVLGRAWANSGYGTVLFERYPTDRLIGTMVRPVFRLEKYFPKPDLLIHLDVSESLSVQRKIEDGHSLEIQRQKRNNYLNFLKQYPFAKSISGECNQEVVYDEACKIIWRSFINCL